MSADASQLFCAAPAASPLESTPKRAKFDDKEKQTCLPVTVRAIEASVKLAAGGPLRFFGTEQGMLLVVGVVDAIIRQSASIEFTLNDATGRIRARHFLMDGSLPKELEELGPGCYISAFGSVRMEPVMHFAVTGLRLVESADEVSYHMIEATYMALKIRKALAAEAPAVAAAPQPAPAAKVILEPSTTVQLSPQKTFRLDGEGLRNSILTFVQKVGSGKPEGVGFVAVCQYAAANASQTDVSSAIKQLLDDGEIYTTFDDLHYQSV
mmetsp:Transcript_23087/g.66605  ORF Transcript_23087/g.66605 Transcript_23087/m.66605 type:complete len:267 (+) Transcript_23087:47-847(+)